MKVLIVLFCTVGFFGCSKPQDAASSIVADRKIFYDVLKRATRVEAFALKEYDILGPDGIGGGFDWEKLDSYTRIGPIVPSQDLRPRISQILTDPATYDGEFSGSGCTPIWGIRLRFFSQKGTADVLLCLNCDVAGYMLDGKYLQNRDFDPGRPAIVKFLKQVFPDDKLIQSLKEVTGPGSALPANNERR